MLKIKIILSLIKQLTLNYLFVPTTWIHLPKTIFFNLKYLPISKAVYLPVYISNRTKVLKISKNAIVIDGFLIPKKIKIGFPIVTIFDRRERTFLEILGKMEIKGHIVIGHGSAISVHTGGVLIIRNNFVATAKFRVICTDKIDIAEDCLFSWNILIMDSDLHPISDYKLKLRINENSPIFIGSKNWICADVSILKGTKTASNTIVGIKSVLTGEYTSSNTIIAGVPAKIIKYDVEWNP